MDCRKFQRNLEDYLEGGLDFAGRFGMERHAQQCYSCGRTESDAQKLKGLALEVKRVSAPPNFEAAVLARIHDGESRFFLGGLRKWWAYGLEWPSWPSLALGVSGLSLFAVAILFSLHHFAGTDPSGEIAAERVSASDRLPSTPSPREGSLTAVAAGRSSSDPVTELPANPLTVSPASSSVRRPRARYSTDELTVELSNPGESDYVEYLVPGPGNRPVIMRLPNTIRMKYGQASEEHFIRNVSH
jgi:Putative zinc-finger